MFLAFLIFDPNRPICKRYSLCMGYSLCNVADFQNCPISLISGVFSSGFCTAQLLCSCRIVFSMFLAFLTLDPNRPFSKGYSLCMGYSLCNIADFQNCRISRIFFFYLAVFCTAQLLCSCRTVLSMFLAFLIFDPNRPICKGYSLCMGYSLCNMADFQNCRISGTFGVFSSGFLHRTTLTFLWNSFSHVFDIFSF